MAEDRNLIRVVSDDAGLPRFARREANRLLPMAAAEPELVPSRLDALRELVLPDLPLGRPDCDYARYGAHAGGRREGTRAARHNAIPSRLTQWVPGDVPGERIDENIPVAALGDLQWRP